MYHRVADLARDPWGLAVSPAHFSEHLEILRRHARPMHLVDLLRAHERGRLPRQAVVLTFDDGYADNLHAAKPALARHDVPATVFVTTGKIGQPREFWWDELERLLLQPGILPSALELRAGRRVHHWTLGPAAILHEAEHERSPHRHPWDAAPGTRLAFYYAVYRVLQRLTHEARDEALAGIAAWCGGLRAERTSHRTLSGSELLTLASDGLVDIGAHTVTHAFLSAHDRDRQRHEIAESRRYLEHALGRRVTSFAYPYGDCPPGAVSLAREQFDCACSTEAAVVSRDSDPFRLPRLEVQNWNGEDFARHLARWLGAANCPRTDRND